MNFGNDCPISINSVKKLSIPAYTLGNVLHFKLCVLIVMIMVHSNHKQLRRFTIQTNVFFYCTLTTIRTHIFLKLISCFLSSKRTPRFSTRCRLVLHIFQESHKLTKSDAGVLHYSSL